MTQEEKEIARLIHEFILHHCNGKEPITFNTADTFDTTKIYAVIRKLFAPRFAEEEGLHCRWCTLSWDNHYNNKCLFGSTSFDPCSDLMVFEELELVRQGRKIDAIKAYRQRRGAGLREAKEAVEREGWVHRVTGYVRPA